MEAISNLLIVFKNEINIYESNNQSFGLKTDIKTGSLESIITLSLSFAGKEFDWKINLNKKSSSVLKLNDFEDIKELIQQADFQEQLNLPLMVYYPASNAPVNAIDFKNASEEVKTDIFNAYEMALNSKAFDFISFFNWYKWQENIEKQLGENPVLNVVRTLT